MSSSIQQYLKGKIDIVLANNKVPDAGNLRIYSKEKAIPVEADISNLKFLKVDVITQDFISKEVFTPKAGDKLKRSFLRHDSKKLAKLILSLV